MHTRKSAWRRALAAVCLLSCLLFHMAPPARAAQQEIPGFCRPILEYWGATTEKELQQAILTYWEENQPQEWNHLHKGAKVPPSFQLGGSTKDLIANQKTWDIAIVSSKDVDLQKLADAGCIIRQEGHPLDAFALHQWLLPKAVQSMLPEHPLYYYAAYCYAYDFATNEAVFIICNDKAPSNHFRYKPWALTLLQSRSADQTRAVEGIRRTFDWAAFEMPEFSFTEEELIEHARDWDWAILHIHKEHGLEKLDAAGLLYDFSQDEFWTNRKSEWKRGDPTAVFSEDGRMIAIPNGESLYNGPDERCVFVINAKSPAIPQALAYAKHYIQSYDWANALESSCNPELEKKYGEGSLAILKEDVNW
ncbi:MAG: hypothetical protein MRZ54_05705 [Clostridiales bacterium]|nr:hypothetical protein [Clostridiales bacterium]